MKTLFFMSGLPRSGSTLLGSILSQHPKLQATPTSPLADLLCYINESFSKLDVRYTYDKKNIEYNTYSSILENFYNHIEKPYIIDKHRGWCKNITSIEKFLHQKPKIIATNRRVSEVLSSFILLIQKNKTEDNFIDAHLRKQGKEINIDNQVECLWKNYISDPYTGLVYGLTNHRDNIHLIDYNDLINDPKKEINKIYEFLEIESYEHNFLNIENSCVEEDDMWGLKNLHQIRSSLQKISPPPEEIIGEENAILYDRFNINI